MYVNTREMPIAFSLTLALAHKQRHKHRWWLMWLSLATLQLSSPAVAWTSSLLPNIISDSLLLHDPCSTLKSCNIIVLLTYCFVYLPKDLFPQTQNDNLKIHSTIPFLQLKRTTCFFIPIAPTDVPLSKMSVLWVVLPVDCPVCLVPLLSVDGTGKKSKGFCAYVANRHHLDYFNALITTIFPNKIESKCPQQNAPNLFSSNLFVWGTYVM